MDVLIVEDDDALRESLVDGLRKSLQALRVEGVGNAEAALALAREKAPRLVVTELRLPDEVGVGLLERVRARWPATPFIFMSARSDPEAEKEARLRNVSILRKPFAIEVLAETVSDALERRGFTGQLGGISLVDLLQVLNMGRRTATVSIDWAGQSGDIHLEGGEIVHAKLGALEGRRAFDVMMTWRGGEFRSEPDRSSPLRTIDEPFNSLLLDAFRVLDEGDVDALASVTPEEKDEDAAGPSAHEILAHLQAGLRTIPGSIAVGCVEIAGEPRLLGLAPADGPPADLLSALPRLARGVLESGPLARADAALVPRPGDRPPRMEEVIALSGGAIHFLQRSRDDADRVYVVVAPSSANLGTVVARSRAWARSTDAAGRHG